MSVGSNLQEMENVVTKGAAASAVMPKSGSNASGVSTPGQTGSYEDLGGPTPENYKVDPMTVLKAKGSQNPKSQLSKMLSTGAQNLLNPCLLV